MLFDTPIFFVFLSVVVAVYWCLGFRNQNRFLLVASYLFYGWWDWRFLCLMIASTIIDYFIAIKIADTKDPRKMCIRDRLENPDAPEIGAAEALVQAGVFLMTNSFERGGSERQFVELARALNPATYSVQVGCCQPKGVLREEIGTVHHFGLGGSLYRLSSMRSRYRLARHLRRTAVAVAHSFDYYTNLMLIPAARLAGTPVVIGSQRQLGDLLTPAQRRAQLAMFRWSDCVI